jgi:hypothetical protein
MKTKHLAEILERVEKWPAHAQDELAEIAIDIERNLSEGDYELTPDERAGIERGLQAAFATDEQVDTALARCRDA